MARPKKQIDPNKVVEELAMRFKSKSEIAAIIGMDEGTVRGRFSESYAKGRELGKAKLRDLQWKSAYKGNVVMQIFLGKQYLGQADRTQVENTGSPLAVVDHKAIMTELLEAKDYASFRRSQAIGQDIVPSPVGTNGKQRPLANGTPPSNGRRGTNGTGGPNGHT